MNENTELEFLSLDVSDVDTVVEWAAAEGWNPGLNDGGIFHAVDPDGWFGAYHNGRLCGSAVATNYDDGFSFAGFYIVAPEYRKRDIGTMLTEMAMKHAGERCIGLDGVMEMAPRYEKVMGMRHGYQGVRFQGISSGSKYVLELASAAEANLEEIINFDSLHFPSERDSFISSWITQKGGRTLVSYDGKGAIDGFGTLRPCRDGHKVGPLFASKTEVAESILHALLSTIAGERFFIDVPDVNRPAMRMVNEMGLKEVFRTARMYSRDPPDFRLDGVYGVTSFELG